MRECLAARNTRRMIRRKLATRRNRAGRYMSTYSGLKYWPKDPHLAEIEIEDIAHALALQCRYNGHCRTFYSVAQHSVLVSIEVERLLGYAPGWREVAMWGLCHDNSEAYIGDMISPLKYEMPEFQRVEALNLEAQIKRFNLRPSRQPPIVTFVDRVLYATERRDLKPLRAPPGTWVNVEYEVAPLPDPIVPWDCLVAETAFLERFRELARGRR